MGYRKLLDSKNAKSLGFIKKITLDKGPLKYLKEFKN